MISINSNTRQFNIPGADLTFGVTGDSGTEVKNFTMPRYVGNNLDVASCFVRINYRNGNGETDTYLVNDVSASAENVTFSWVLTPKVTEYRGQIKFVVCLVGPDLKLKWHTTQGTGQVLEGLEPDNGHVESDTADVVAALIAMVEAQTVAVEGVGAEQMANVRSAAETARTAAVAEIEAKRANSLASIPNDYSALSAAVEKTARVTAPGIVCDVEGRVISVGDASDQPIRGLRVFGKSTQTGVPTPDNPVEIVSVESPAVIVAGKNLIPKLSAYSGHGITITENPDGTSTINGTTTNTLGYKGNSVFLPAGTYTLKCNRTLSESTWLSISNTPLMIFPGDYKKTFTLESGEHWLYFYANAGVTFDNYVLEAQLEFGDTATDIEPHSSQTIETAHPLRGIPVTTGGNYTDENGQQWICDEVDLERGVYVKRINRGTAVLDQVRTLPDTGMSYCAVHFADKKLTSSTDFMCDRARVIKYSSGAVRPGDVYENTGNFVFVDAPNATLEEMKAKFDGATVQYILATPIETPLTEAELAAYRTLHTNKPNTTILNDSGAHMSVKYTADTKLYIDKKIKEALQ